MKIYKTSAITFASLLTHGFESMTFGGAEGDADQGWLLAGLSGTKSWGQYSDWTGTNKAGSISLRQAELANNYGLYRAITATREVRIEFYVGRYSAGAPSGTQISAVGVDDGGNDKGIVGFVGGGNDPANALGVLATYDITTTPDEFKVGVWYRYASGSNNSILSISDISLGTVATGTKWVGVRVDITDTSVRLYLDINDNGIFELYENAAWTSPFSSTPFNAARVSTEIDATDESALDSIAISSITINTGNEITNKKKIQTSNKLDGSGEASFIYIDHDYSEKATVKALMLVDCIVTDDNTGTVFFHGYFVEWGIHTEGFILKAIESINKLRHYQANYDPVRLKGRVAWIDDAEIRNEDIDFSGNNAYPVIIEDTSKTKTYALIKTYAFFEADGTTPYIPKDNSTATEAGDVNNLSKFDPNWARNSIGGHALGAYSYKDAILGITTFDTWIMQLTCPMYYKENTAISSLKLHIVFSLGGASTPGPIFCNSAINKDAKVEIYNYTSTSWETLETLQCSDMSEDEEAITTTTNHLITAALTKQYNSFSSSTLNDYKDTAGEGAANSSGFIETSFRFRIQTLDGGIAGDNFHDVWIHEAYFEIVWDDNQILELSTANTSTTADNTMTLDDNLEIEGISRNDNIYITETITTILDSIWTQSGIDAIFTLDRTEQDDRGDFENYTYKSVWYVLQKYKDLGYYMWQYDDIVRFKKTFITSGLTITEADIHQFTNTRLGFFGSVRKMRNSILLLGGSNIIKTKSITPDIANAFIELIERSDVLAEGVAQEIVDNLSSTIHKKPNYSGVITLNWDKSTDYSNARVGTTFDLSLLSGALLDFSSGGADGEPLVITELHTAVLEGKNIVKLFVSLDEV